MRIDPTTIRRGPIVAALIVIAIMLGSALAGISTVMAGEPSKCGVQSTGIDKTIRTTAEPNGRVVSGAFPGRWVDRSGIWRDCQRWVDPVGGDPEAPEPAPQVRCAARQTYEAWEVDGRVCTSIPPGVAIGMQLMLPERKPGQQALIRSDRSWVAMGKPTHGFALHQCVLLPNGAAEWRLVGATCHWAND